MDSSLPNTDILSDVLRALRIQGTVYFCDQLEPPWKNHYPGQARACFHQIRRGGCRLKVGNKQDHLGPGDFVFIAPNKEHYLISEPISPDSGVGGAETYLLCGYCSLDETGGTPLNDLFPDLIIMRDHQLQSMGWLRGILDQISYEYLSVRPGTDIVVSRLTEILIVELIRMNFGRNEQVPIIQALDDNFIGKALQSLHQRCDKPWSLEMLAADVGLSRAAFAKRFKTLVGQSMFDYLTALRIRQACQLLAETALPLSEVAHRVGYESDLAFTRTFKKRMGQTPTHYRKHAADANPT